MSTSKSKLRVLIIGAGLGGTALAQSLRKQDIDYELFERDSSDESRSQGWAISLHDWFLKDLLAATKDDMPKLETLSTTYELGIPAEGDIFDAVNMSERRSCESGVRWAKKFSHYEQDENGITAFFEDGTLYRGSVLVGADGIGSRVRNQLLPDPNEGPKYLPTGIIVGELTANEEQYQRWLKIATSFFIGNEASRRLFVGLKNMAPDQKSASYYWIFGWKDPQAAEKSFWTTNATQKELHSFVMGNLDGLHQSFTEVIRATPVDGMVYPPIRMRDMTPHELPRGRVTLLGDAIHPMVSFWLEPLQKIAYCTFYCNMRRFAKAMLNCGQTPFRGEGGNMARKDAFSLASCVTAENGMSVEDMLKDYEREMTPRTTKSVLASREAGKSSAYS